MAYVNHLLFESQTAHNEKMKNWFQNITHRK